MKTIKFTTNKFGKKVAILDGVEYRLVNSIPNNVEDYFLHKGLIYARKRNRLS